VVRGGGGGGGGKKNTVLLCLFLGGQKKERGWGGGGGGGLPVQWSIYITNPSPLVVAVVLFLLSLVIFISHNKNEPPPPPLIAPNTKHSGRLQPRHTCHSLCPFINLFRVIFVSIWHLGSAAISSPSAGSTDLTRYQAGR